MSPGTVGKLFQWQMDVEVGKPGLAAWQSKQDLKK